jgi:hypothetical protein
VQIHHDKQESKGEINNPAARSNLYLSIRNLLLEEVISYVEEDVNTIERLRSHIRNEIEIFAVKKRNSFLEVTGVDAGSQVLPLASRKFAVISALAYSLSSGNRFYLEPESFVYHHLGGIDQMSSIINVKREAKLYETASCFIESNSRVQLIMVDGPLAFSNWWNIAGRDVDRRRLIEAVKRFLLLCSEKNITVAGVVKRPSARYLIYHLGLQRETDLSDSFIMLQTLNPGERTDIFSPRASIRKALKTSPFMDAIGHPIYSYYIRLSREWSSPPVRIDLPAFCLSYIEEVSDFCYGSSYWNGIPLPIVMADEEVKISKRFLSEIYKDIVSQVGCLTGEVSHLAPYWGEGSWMGA